MIDDDDGAPGRERLPAADARRTRPMPSSAAAPRGPRRAPDPVAARPRRAPGPATARPRSVPDPAAASRRMMRQIAAARRLRRQRLALGMVGVMSALTLLVSGSAWVLTSYVSASLGRVDAGTSGTPLSGPVNILVAGVDTRDGLTRRQEIRLHVGDVISANSDTLMLVHIPADHASARIVSLPRDSWVSIPGHGMNKINAAYGLGGPRLMVATVEQATGIAVNDYVEVNFLGFVKVINALGGVNVCLPYAVDDPYSGLHLSAGRHHVDGVTALKFARDRHSFALSDIARISDQQQLLSSLFAEATRAGVVANPIRLQRFLSSATAAVKVDRGFDLVRLAQELRGIRPSDVTFTTVPLSSMNYITPTGESAVLWNRAQAAALFRSLKKDAGTARSRPVHGKLARKRARARTTAPGGARTAAQDACR
jgi:LCP family protein required for cell wall assembly